MKILNPLSSIIYKAPEEDYMDFFIRTNGKEYWALEMENGDIIFEFMEKNGMNDLKKYFQNQGFERGDDYIVPKNKIRIKNESK